MTTLREAAQQALEALTNCTSEYGHRCNRCDSEVDEGGKVVDALRAALAEEALQRLTDVQQEMERNFCPRCGKRSFPDTIHTCTPPQASPEGDALTAAYMLGRYDGKRRPLTDEELDALAMDEDGLPNSHIEFARAIERAHGIKE